MGSHPTEFPTPLRNKPRIQIPNQQTQCKVDVLESDNNTLPHRILQKADYIWKLTKERDSFGQTHTVPTPSTIQQLGLGITTAFTTHIQNAIKMVNHKDIQAISPTKHLPHSTDLR
jgi:hypothetical protein